jgi:biotin-(acetyl-CoA carboxylase) ligase
LTKRGYQEIYAAYTGHLYKRGKTVKLRKANRVFEAQIMNVLPGGKLLIRHATEEEIDFGEVEWLR